MKTKREEEEEIKEWKWPWLFLPSTKKKKEEEEKRKIDTHTHTEKERRIILARLINVIRLISLPSSIFLLLQYINWPARYFDSRKRRATTGLWNWRTAKTKFCFCGEEAHPSRHWNRLDGFGESTLFYAAPLLVYQFKDSRTWTADFKWKKDDDNKKSLKGNRVGTLQLCLYPDRGRANEVTKET